MFNLRKTIAISVAAATVAVFAVGAQAATGNGIANGGFENAPAIFATGTQPGPGLQGAGYWLTPGGSGAATLSTDAHSGLYSASVTCPQLCGSTLFGNSVDNGGLAALDPSNWGTSPVFSFWAKGNTGSTGSLTYALRYLDAIGNILAQSNQNFSAGITADWKQFSTSIAIPTGATAVFFETTFAQGPVGDNGNGGIFTGGGFKIDDINLSVNVAAVPEPESYAMLMAGLGGIGFLIRRRRPS